MMNKEMWTSRALSRTLTLIYRSFSSSSTSSFGIKNVTLSNFESTLVELRQHIRGADFVAIDLEMTGITSAPWRESLELDRFDIRYLKVKDSAHKFAVVQLGVCPFRWDSSVSSFVAHPLVTPLLKLFLILLSSYFLSFTYIVSQFYSQPQLLCLSTSTPSD